MAPERALAAMLKDGGTEVSPRDVVAFTKLAEGIASATTLEEVLWAVAHEALGTMQLEDVVIYLVDQTRGVCVQAAAYGPKNPEGRTIKAPLEIPLGKGVVGRVARTGEAALVPDVSVDPDYIPDDVARLSELTVPIIADGEVLGVIDSEHSVAGFFTPRHQTVFTAIARLAAPRIEQFVLRARLEAAADARLQAQVQRLERRFAREQRARREAERLLETKSRELFDLNQSLAQRASGLQAQLLESTGETVRIREIYQTVLDRLPDALRREGRPLEADAGGASDGVRDRGRDRVEGALTAVGGGFFVSWGLDGDAINAVVGAVSTLAGIIWSVWDKRKA